MPGRYVALPSGELTNEKMKGKIMLRIMLSALLLVALAVPALAADQPDFIEFQKILDNKCSKCHSRTRVDKAMAEHRDMLEIQQRMIKHGAELNSHEQQVLGVFFRAQKVEKNTGSVVNEKDPLAEYRTILKARCSGCHSLDVVEKAMRNNRKFDALAKMMIKRGAVLNDKDMKIIQTFWGEPLK